MTSSESLSFFSPEYTSPRMFPVTPSPRPPPSSSLKRGMPSPSPMSQIIMSKQALNQPLTPEVSCEIIKNKPAVQYVVPRQRRRTNPAVWCAAILCMLFSLLLISFGIGTLVIFLSIKPRNPVFDTSNASLSVIYLDSPKYMNGDFTFIANFTNPNKKLDVRFEHLAIELFFSDSLIATKVLQPFTQRQRETRIVQVHMISSLVYLPPISAFKLQKQVLSNRVVYNIRGTFKVRVNIGLIHYSYWLHGRCQLEMTSPPAGALITHSCRTKR
ncbi:NDR1/HIN1-like protein 6 [Capsicum galapagoense]